MFIFLHKVAYELFSLSFEQSSMWLWQNWKKTFYIYCIFVYLEDDKFHLSSFSEMSVMSRNKNKKKWLNSLKILWSTSDWSSLCFKSIRETLRQAVQRLYCTGLPVSLIIRMSFTAMWRKGSTPLRKKLLCQLFRAFR